MLSFICSYELHLLKLMYKNTFNVKISFIIVLGCCVLKIQKIMRIEIASSCLQLRFFAFFIMLHFSF